MEFQQQLVVPGTWKTEVKEESSSSEEDDDDEEEEQEEDASREEEEVGQEASCMLLSLQTLRKMMLKLVLFPVCRRKWNRSQRRGRIFYSSCTSSWRTEVSPHPVQCWFSSKQAWFFFSFPGQVSFSHSPPPLLIYHSALQTLMLSLNIHFPSLNIQRLLISIHNFYDLFTSICFVATI